VTQDEIREKILDDAIEKILPFILKESSKASIDWAQLSDEESLVNKIVDSMNMQLSIAINCIVYLTKITLSSTNFFIGGNSPIEEEINNIKKEICERVMDVEACKENYKERHYDINKH
jgi:hypothetical protein